MRCSAVVIRAFVLITFLGLAGCANGALYMPSESNWHKPGASQGDRAYAMLDCQSAHGLAFDGLRGTVALRRFDDPARFQRCMEQDGWRLAAD